MKIVEKPWGRETWVAVTDKYALKIIELKKGSRCSLQYHNQKHEHIYVDSGMLQVEFGDDVKNLKTMTLKPGEALEYPAGRIHRSTALEDTRVIEVSTPELDDLVRIEDDYGR
jgi:mannose-6-phosphate isomerase